MKNDAISRSAVLDTIAGVDWYHVNQKGNLVHGSCSDYESWVKYDEVISSIENAPALDVAPVVHARWEYLFGDYYCTNCDKKLRRSSRTKRPKYCERCGARMDGEVNDNGQ